jgi:hypothetical protein
VELQQHFHAQKHMVVSQNIWFEGAIPEHWLKMTQVAR